MIYCEFVKGKKSYCKKTNDKDKASDDCEISKTRRCVLKKKLTKKKVSKKKQPVSRNFTSLKCSNEEDPISLSGLKDEVSIDDVIALPFKDDKTICFEGESLWGMFSNHVNHDANTFLKASKGDFSGIAPIDMSVWGISQDLLKIDVAQEYLKKRAHDGLKNKEFRDPTAPFKIESNNTRLLLETFLSERIDLHGDIHIEYLTKAILGDHTENGKNIQPQEWRTIVEVIYGSWISQSRDLWFLQQITTTARRTLINGRGFRSEDMNRSLFVHTLIELYNELLISAKKYNTTITPNDARTKITHLLWMLQLSIQD